MADELINTRHFFCAHLPSEEIQGISTRRVRQARELEVGDPGGMVVLSPVPTKHGGNVVVRLDDDLAPASRPLARPRLVPTLPDVFFLTARPIARARVDPALVPKWAVRTTYSRNEQLDPVIAFLAHAPRVELFQRVPLVSRTPFLPVVRDASQPFGGRGVDDNIELKSADYRIVDGWWTVTVRLLRLPCGDVDCECAKAAFKSRDHCWSWWLWNDGNAKDRKRRHAVVRDEDEGVLISTANSILWCRCWQKSGDAVGTCVSLVSVLCPALGVSVLGKVSYSTVHRITPLVFYQVCILCRSELGGCCSHWISTSLLRWRSISSLQHSVQEREQNLAHNMLFVAGFILYPLRCVQVHMFKKAVHQGRTRII